MYFKVGSEAPRHFSNNKIHHKSFLYDAHWRGIASAIYRFIIAPTFRLMFSNFASFLFF